MGNRICCFDSKQSDDYAKKHNPPLLNSLDKLTLYKSSKKSYTTSIMSKRFKNSNAMEYEEKVTKIEIGQIAADMFGTDDNKLVDESYL